MTIVKFGRFFGTGAVCFGLLGFEIVTARILGVVLESHLAIFAIALAMLGMGAATSVLSLQDPARGKAASPAFLSALAMLLGLTYLACFVGIALFSARSNINIEQAIDFGGLAALVESIRESIVHRILTVGAILFTPYFVFGLFIVKLFQSGGDADYHKLYAADLIGAALGCILAVVSLDHFGYAGGFALVLLSTFLGAAALAGAHSRVSTVASLGLAIGVLWFASTPAVMHGLQPEPPLNQLSRNYDKDFDVIEQWHTWNAHSRIALLSMQDRETGDVVSQVYAHESGEGWATVPNPDLGPADWVELVTMYQPKRVLVLFAGVGHDMMSVDQLCEGDCEITGVEINEHMVDHALNHGPESLRAFLARPEITLEVAEAREFLERDDGSYDAILLSWWGAGTSHYVGTSGRLAGYLYTKEAYQTLLDHLNPGGTIMLFNGSKAQSLVNFRAVFEARGEGGLADRALIVKERSEGPIQASRSFYDILENMRLIIKPSGFSEADLAKARAVSSKMNADIVLAPGEAAEGYEVYREIVEGIDLDRLNDRLIESHGTELSIVSDDRPFINELVPRAYYLDLSKWLDGGAKDHPLWSIVRGYLAFVVFLSVVAVILILGPLLVRGGPGMSKSNVVSLFYFLSLGAGFILVEVGLVRKLGLLLGHPSYALSVVLAGLILSTGLGSLLSRKAFQSGLLTVKRAALGIIAYSLAGLFLYDLAAASIITLPLFVKGFLVILFLLPLGLLMGQLFPQGLVRVGRSDARLVSWAWAINSVSSTIFVGVGYLLSYPLGFSALIYLGLAFYAILLVLPLKERAKVPDEQSVPMSAEIELQRS